MKQAVVEPYLFFGGRCEEAIAFYQRAIGAQVQMMMRYNESPEPQPPGMLPAGFDKKIMHSSFRVGGTVVMASDGCSENAKFDGFSLSISVPTEQDARKAFDGLSQGGKVTLPLTKTFWSPCFGMLTDQFGLGWMITIEGPR
jgi:PhnB protein